MSYLFVEVMCDFVVDTLLNEYPDQSQSNIDLLACIGRGTSRSSYQANLTC